MVEKRGEDPLDCPFRFLGGLGDQIWLENRSTASAPRPLPAVRICVSRSQLTAGVCGRAAGRRRAGEARPAPRPPRPLSHPAFSHESTRGWRPPCPPMSRTLLRLSGNTGARNPFRSCQGGPGERSPAQKVQTPSWRVAAPFPGAPAAEVGLTFTGGSEPFCPD